MPSKGQKKGVGPHKACGAIMLWKHYFYFNSVIIVCFDVDEVLVRFLRMAHMKGMRAPDYVIISPGHVIAANTLQPWIDDPHLTKERTEEWKKILVELNYKQVRAN